MREENGAPDALADFHTGSRRPMTAATDFLKREAMSGGRLCCRLQKQWVLLAGGRGPVGETFVTLVSCDR